MYRFAWQMLGLLADCSLQRFVCNCNKDIIIIIIIILSTSFFFELVISTITMREIQHS